MTIICTYNNSSLYLFYKDIIKLTFEGELEDIARGLFLGYGKVPIEKFLHKSDEMFVRNDFKMLTNIAGPLWLRSNADLEQSLEWCTEYAQIGDVTEDPIFLDCLNQKYINVFNRYSKIKTFW